MLLAAANLFGLVLKLLIDLSPECFKERFVTRLTNFFSHLSSSNSRRKFVGTVSDCKTTV